MLVDYGKLLKHAPLVEAKKFARSDKINMLGYCSPYLFAEHPKCLCEGVRHSHEDLNTVCKTCHHKIMRNTGLGAYDMGEDFVLLHPAIYAVLRKMKMNLVKSVTAVDINGVPIPSQDDDQYLNYAKLIELGTTERRVAYLREIVSSFSSKKVSDFMKLLDLLEAKGKADSLFIRKIPIIHLRFRADEKGEQSELNKLYGSLLRTVETLKESSELRKTLNTSLFGIQEILFRIGLNLIEIEALQNYFFPSVSFSSRSPVLSSPLTDDFRGITIGYAVYKTIYKFRIMHFLRKLYGCSYQDALNEITYRHEFGSDEFKVVLAEIKKEAVMLINRVPSLMLENLIAVRLNGVIESSVFLTPQIVFKYLSQDSDGDVISCIPLFTKEAKEVAMNVFGVTSFLRSKYDFNEFYLSSYVLGYDKYGAHVLEREDKERRENASKI